MMPFAGCGQLVRLIVRRDRIRIPVWVIALAVLAAGTAGAYDSLYPTAADRQGLDIQFGSNKAIALVTGPVHGLATAGGFTEWRLGGSVATLVALMAIFMIVRHTRADEEAGRTELVTAQRVGRLAPLAAALIATIGSCLLIGLVLAGALIAAGTGVVGSIAFGAASALCGVVFASIAAIAAQLSTFARTASALAGATLGAAFVLRGLGDSTDSFSWLSWLSPIGWAQQLRPYNGERWWVLALSIVLCLAALAVAFALQSTRDLGAGLIDRSTGPAVAGPGLRSAGALAWREHRAGLIAWLAGAVITGALFGTLANAVGDIASTSPQIQVILEKMGGSKAISQTFIGTAVGMTLSIVAFYIAQTLWRVRDEETSGRAELLLSTPVSRLSWLRGHLLAAYGGITAIALAVGLAIGTAASLATPDIDFGDVIGTAAAHIPALWIVAGACLCIYGWLPDLSTLVWTVVGLALAISVFGQMLNAPDWLLKLSPYTTAPKVVSGSSFDWVTLAIHLGIALVLLVAGVIGVRRRDIPS